MTVDHWITLACTGLTTAGAIAAAWITAKVAQRRGDTDQSSGSTDDHAP